MLSNAPPFRQAKRPAEPTPLPFSWNTEMGWIIGLEVELLKAISWLMAYGRRKVTHPEVYQLERLVKLYARALAHHGANILREMDVEWALWEAEGRGE